MKFAELFCTTAATAWFSFRLDLCRYMNGCREARFSKIDFFLDNRFWCEGIGTVYPDHFVVDFIFCENRSNFLVN